MTRSTVFAAFAAAMFLVAAAPASYAQDLASLAKESTQLPVEKGDIATKLEQSVKTKHANEHDFDVLDKEAVNIKAEGGRVEAQRPKVESLCHRTVPKDQLAAATAQCNAVLIPFNKDVDLYKTHRGGWTKRHDAVVKKEEARVAAAKKLMARSDVIEKRQAVLRDAITLRLKNAKLQCMQDCVNAGKDDAQSYCLQRCWDNAVAGLSPVERNRQYQAQFGTRTVEQAIEDYKKSGRANPGPPLKINPVPPPPK
jgi:hypothetical protein